MATLNALTRIASHLDWSEDEDNADGYVAAVSDAEERDLEKAFCRAGYDTSTSSDVHGQHWLWVSGEPG